MNTTIKDETMYVMTDLTAQIWKDPSPPHALCSKYLEQIYLITADLFSGRGCKKGEYGELINFLGYCMNNNKHLIYRYATCIDRTPMDICDALADLKGVIESYDTSCA